MQRCLDLLWPSPRTNQTGAQQACQPRNQTISALLFKINTYLPWLREHASHWALYSWFIDKNIKCWAIYEHRPDDLWAMGCKTNREKEGLSAYRTKLLTTQSHIYICVKTWWLCNPSLILPFLTALWNTMTNRCFSLHVGARSENGGEDYEEAATHIQLNSEVWDWEHSIRLTRTPLRSHLLDPNNRVIAESICLSVKTCHIFTQNVCLSFSQLTLVYISVYVHNVCSHKREILPNIFLIVTI